MKILFLDIDGVCNSEESFKKGNSAMKGGRENHIDAYMAFLVGKIQLDTDCKVVLSSSWRHHPESVKFINERVVPIHDITGHCCTGIRGAEIHQWLQKNVKGFSSTYDGDFRIAILDDDNDMLLWQKDHFFKTSWKTGLTDEIANKVIEHLNK